MIVFPAIDLRDGKCVRLTKGDFARQTVFSEVPAQMASRWQEQGAEYLHLVDLDGALAGVSKNLEAIKEIVSVLEIPCQLGGGIRSVKSIEAMLALGVSRVILGSAAVKEPELVKFAVKEYSEQIVVGIDARDNIVAVDGWGVSGDVQAGELALRMADVGVARIIFTDIARDGMMSGVNAEATAALARKSGLQVIASGGVASLEDIRTIKNYAKDGIEGCIVGKALYLGAFELGAAISIARED